MTGDPLDKRGTAGKSRRTKGRKHATAIGWCQRRAQFSIETSSNQEQVLETNIFMRCINILANADSSGGFRAAKTIMPGL